jgi:hypothetical protein
MAHFGLVCHRIRCATELYFSAPQKYYRFYTELILSVSMDFVSQEHGYHATDPRIRTQGAERVRPWIAMKHGDGSLDCRTRKALQRGRPSFTQVQGPRGEVKPLLPAFLYYDATPREEYKALVTKLSLARG